MVTYNFIIGLSPGLLNATQVGIQLDGLLNLVLMYTY